MSHGHGEFGHKRGEEPFPLDHDDLVEPLDHDDAMAPLDHDDEAKQLAFVKGAFIVALTINLHEPKTFSKKGRILKTTMRKKTLKLRLTRP